MKTITEIKNWLWQQDQLSKEQWQQLSNDPRIGVRKLVTHFQRHLEKQKLEAERLQRMWLYEQKQRDLGHQRIAGIDEAGRGPLAGPVVAAAVILPSDFDVEGLNDSKLLSPKKREELRIRIEQEAVSIGIGIIDNQEIDRVNILQATYQAMRVAIQSSKQLPDHLLVDAAKIPHITIGQTAIVKGDQLSHSIAAASIIAKTTRDRLMLRMAEQYPQYGFEKHMGYGTPEHLVCLAKFGPSPIHRYSFAPVQKCVQREIAGAKDG